MSLQNPTSVVTEERLNQFYTDLLPYLGGSADAGFTPVGTIISVMGNHAPANYLICDGTVYNIADYPELANYFYDEFGSKNKFGGNGTTTFAVPNLLGEFLRMTGTNSHANQGNGAAVGVHQDATEHFIIANHNSANTIYTTQVTDATWASPKNKDSLLPTKYDIKYVATTSFNDTANGLYTSRPTNTSVLYCIATKNITMGGGGYIELTDTLTVGQTSITFTNSAITSTSTIDVYTDDDVEYNSISTSIGSLTITFDAQASDLGVKVRVS